MASLADLTAIIGPPRKPAPLVDWAAIEAETALVFPDDYKEWAARYANIRLSNFLYVSRPDAAGEERQGVIARLNQLRPLIEEWGTIDLVNDEGEEIEAPPFPLYPEPEGLYPWGATDNGDYLLWLTTTDPSPWTVVVTDGATWWHFPGSLTDFLVGIMSRSVRCPLFPKDFPERTEVEEYTPEDYARITAEHDAWLADQQALERQGR
ncbi:SMI1/KNR4 family protein [Microbispora sp. H10670]|uniref:SMI1/KNR4 family protein n=1 Tax=Microbispora sp. H10670 TaxID=2729108 RepID=UPI0015FEE795|nr:SMI1/KNR4 family protein [Microbispora sp. H10670]